MVFISEGSYWQSVATLDKLGAISVVPASIHTLQWSMLDAKAAQRSYVETGEPAQRQAFDEARRQMSESFKSLDSYYAGQPLPTALLLKLHGLTQLNSRPLKLDALSVGDSDAAQMAAFRTLSAELLAHEAGNVAVSRSALYRTQGLGRIGVAALSSISLLALFMYLRQTQALKAKQRELQRSVQVAHDLLELEVAQRTVQLTELTQHLQTAREDERNRLARDLHDELGALLTSAKLDAARIKSRLGAGNVLDALERLVHLVGTLNSGIALKRRIVEDLRPSALSTLGLVATLEILAREFAERSDAEVICALQPVELTASAELVVYRLVQEAVTNISKYAKAAHVWIELAPLDGRVHISVRDDGVGFDTRVPPTSAYGLVGMRFRVEAEQGVMTLVSAPRQGCTIQASLPRTAAARLAV